MSDTQTLTLTDFLLARIAEDEAVASAATEGSLYHRYARMAPGAIGEHFARHDPARVLAECEARRRVIEKAGRAPMTSAASAFVLESLAEPYRRHPSYPEEAR